jgi:chromosome segregation ATPase
LLNQEIEEIQKKHNFNLKNIEEAFQSQFDSLIDQKEQQILKLNSRVNELELINSDLNLKLEENLNLIQEYKNTTYIKYQEFQLELRNRDLEILNLKNNLDKMQEFQARNIEQENNKIIYDYEVKIESIIKQFEESRNKMNKIIDEKEKERNILINKHEEELNIVERQKDELRAEIDCHKTNILALRNKRNTIENEIMQLNEFVEKLKQDLRSQNAEIKILENQNHKLFTENV